jgi:hypothetical protein
MKKCLIYCMTIYILLIIFILLQNPKFLYDQNNNIKSWNYLKYKIKYGINKFDDIICFPTIVILISILSYILAKKFV